MQKKKQLDPISGWQMYIVHYGSVIKNFFA